MRDVGAVNESPQVVVVGVVVRAAASTTIGPVSICRPRLNTVSVPAASATCSRYDTCVIVTSVSCTHPLLRSGTGACTCTHPSSRCDSTRNTWRDRPGRRTADGVVELAATACPPRWAASYTASVDRRDRGATSDAYAGSTVCGVAGAGTDAPIAAPIVVLGTTIVVGTPPRSLGPPPPPPHAASQPREPEHEEPLARIGTTRIGRTLACPELIPRKGAMTEPALDADPLVATALDATGLDDFGEATWRDGLERLVDSLDTEARLHELGEQIVAGEIVDYLVDPPRDSSSGASSIPRSPTSTSCRRS